jgi:SAM-dependent methyltransferase
VTVPPDRPTEAGVSGWTTVCVDCGPVGTAATATTAEVAADRLWPFGPAAVEEREVDGRVHLLAGFESPEAADAAARGLAAAPELGATGAGAAMAGVTGAGLEPVAVAVRPVTDDGLDGWRPWARVETAGPFRIVPAWLPDPEPAPAGPEPAWTVRLLVDPGRTFGSGSHPTTRLSLEALALVLGPADDRDPRAAEPTVLDVGTGSGVLAVGAAVLGARVDAIDVDPASPAVVAANAARNGVADLVTASNDPLAQVAATGRTYDLVLANLLAPVIRALGTDLAAVTAPGGTIVVSGLLVDGWEEPVAHVPAFVPVAVHVDDGWVAVVLRRAADVPAP